MAGSEITIVYIITKMELGGAQKVCLTLFNDVPKDTKINCFLITGSQGPLVKTIVNNPHVILLDQLVREIGLTGIFGELRAFFALVKQLRMLKKTHTTIIVHTHSTKAGLLGRWAALFAGIKTRVHTVHGFGFNDFQPRAVWLVIYLLELVASFITTKFICVSQADIATGSKRFPGFAHKSCLIRAAVDFDQFYRPAHTLNNGEQKHPPYKKIENPFALILRYKFAAQIHSGCTGIEWVNGPKPFVFGTIACFKKQKNLFDLLQAFELVFNKHPHARLEIIGDGLLRPEIEAWIAQRKLDHAITLHGWQEHVAPIAMNWHAFVLSSLWEGLPCAVVEARLLKLPVLSYKTGGIPEIIFDQINGLLYEQKNWFALAHGMTALIENPALYTQLSTHADDLILFHNQAMIDHHRNLYQKLLQKQDYL